MQNKVVYAILFLFFAANASTVQAQFDAGVAGGISIPNLTTSGSDNNPLNTGYSSRLGPEFGLVAEYHISKLFSLAGKLVYSSQGGKKDGLQAFATPSGLGQYFQSQGLVPPTYLYANYKSEARLNYLRLPVLGKIGWDLGGSHFRVAVAAGPFVGFLLSAKQVTSGNSGIYLDMADKQPLPVGSQSFDQKTDIKDQLNKVNFGADGNISLAYAFRSRDILFVEAGGNYGIINIQKGSANGKNNTGAATLLLGYACRFRCK